jgi:phenylacetic acid degradation operon negative regulatory protein
MASRGTLISSALQSIANASGTFEWPIEGTEGWRRKQIMISRKQFSDNVWQLKRRKLVKVIKKNSKQFLEITKKGELEILLRKAHINNNHPWDGKWRVLTFDIPEESHDQRDRLRGLLKKNNFVKLQASVFVHPYALNREAIYYLKQSGLYKYIRIMKVEEMDNDSDLKKKFNL